MEGYSQLWARTGWERQRNRHLNWMLPLHPSERYHQRGLLIGVMRRKPPSGAKYLNRGTLNVHEQVPIGRRATALRRLRWLISSSISTHTGLRGARSADSASCWHSPRNSRPHVRLFRTNLGVLLSRHLAAHSSFRCLRPSFGQTDIQSTAIRCLAAIPSFANRSPGAPKSCLK